MKEGHMKCNFIAPIRKDRDAAWRKFFNKIMDAFKQTDAEITDVVVDANGDVDIRYLY